MEEELDIAEVKKVLEDANIYDPDLTEELMINYYKAIKDSKDTATMEDECRRINESQEEIHKDLNDDTEYKNMEISPSKIKEKPFIPKAWTSEKKLDNDIPEHNNNQNLKEDNISEELISDSPKDATKVTFGFNEMVKDSEHTLNIISHKLKFVSVQNSQIFLNSGTAIKAQMLYAYHTKVNKMKNQLARMSFYPAPLPKVTSVFDTFPSLSDDVDFQETYVCRSGRQTKRKVYNYDDDDSLDGISNKKTKNSEEQEWLCKVPQNKSTIRKKSESNHTDPEETESEVTDTVNDNIKQPQKTETRTPLSRKPTISQIMKRSSLFADTPKRRCETMFDKLKEEEQKKQNEEKARDLFYKTLEQEEEENNETVSSEEVITVDDDEPIHKRKKDISKQNSSSNSSQDTDEVVIKTNVKKRLGLRKPCALGSGAESFPSTSQFSKAANASDVSCPICNRLFSVNVIQEHAATCGDEPVTRSTSKISRITCEVCDKVVDFETNFEVHVNECNAKKKAKNL
ncbi:hypothetical protein NQ314_013556 [Rhamnusium bicolor]|uniref:Uncharacterized protein n=1 Tax=Rhamnusium bicolor TaxID=1586634 RepID=A0AAV8X5V3_9CUCU|nr:hypothetical protein NQ314_013556 [Rhamnusium bicolor]